MTEWHEVVLGDVCELKRGYDLPKGDREPGTGNRAGRVIFRPDRLPLSSQSQGTGGCDGSIWISRTGLLRNRRLLASQYSALRSRLQGQRPAIRGSSPRIDESGPARRCGCSPWTEPKPASPVTRACSRAQSPGGHRSRYWIETVQCGPPSHGSQNHVRRWQVPLGHSK